MILFGHLGLTFIAGQGIVKAINYKKGSSIKIDYRILFLGSILPDLIDKTIVFFNSNGVFKSGRLIAHTFLFTLVLFIIGMIVFKLKKRNWMLVLALGTFIHLLLDSMWNYMDILFWPVYSFPFSQKNLNFSEIINYSLNIFNKDNPVVSISSITDRLISNPIIGLSELAGFFIILQFIRCLIKFKQTNIFLHTGHFDFIKK